MSGFEIQLRERQIEALERENAELFLERKELQARIAELTAVLEYYADLKNYFGGNTAKILDDAGNIAKKALGGQR